MYLVTEYRKQGHTLYFIAQIYLTVFNNLPVRSVVHRYLALSILLPFDIPCHVMSWRHIYLRDVDF